VSKISALYGALLRDLASRVDLSGDVESLEGKLNELLPGD
jgi:hypothetical protein